MNKKILTAITIVGLMLISIGVVANPPKADIEIYRNCELGIKWGRIVGKSLSIKSADTIICGKPDVLLVVGGHMKNGIAR